MILVTGGLGFIGLHTARSLIDLGEECVLTRYHVARDPEFLHGEIGTRAHVEQLDVTDAAAFAALGEKYPIDGIIHLAVPGLGALGPFEDFETNMSGLLNAMRCAEAWGVKRISVASSTAVYTGVTTNPLREDMPLSLTGGSPTEAYKKSYEILSGHMAQRAGLDCVALRIAGIYGPLYHSMMNLPSRLVHAAVKGEAPDLSRGSNHQDDGGDLCYVRDCGRGIALVQTAERLNHRVYNVGSGHPTTNQEIADAVRKVVPEAKIDLPAGHAPTSTGVVTYQDLTRIREDTGYEPEFSTEEAIADYVEWLRAGNAE